MAQHRRSTHQHASIPGHGIGGHLQLSTAPGQWVQEQALAWSNWTKPHCCTAQWFFFFFFLSMQLPATRQCGPTLRAACHPVTNPLTLSSSISRVEAPTSRACGVKPSKVRWREVGGTTNTRAAGGQSSQCLHNGRCARLRKRMDRDSVTFSRAFSEQVARGGAPFRPFLSPPLPSPALPSTPLASPPLPSPPLPFSRLTSWMFAACEVLPDASGVWKQRVSFPNGRLERKGEMLTLSTRLQVARV